jgi:hypothetical protein
VVRGDGFLAGFYPTWFYFWAEIALASALALAAGGGAG